jgi:hypothetical protein
MDIVDYLESLIKLDVEKAANIAIMKTRDKLGDLNRKQLSEGIRADDEKMHWMQDNHYPYVKPYARIRENMGLQTDFVDLKVTGDFWNSIDVIPENDEVIFFSMDDKAQYLEENYSKEIFGINDKNLETYTEDDFSPVFFEELEEQTGLL